MSERAAALTDTVVAFCEHLRAEHAFTLGIGETQDALRALDIVGLNDLPRARHALRLVCCASRDDVGVFDRVFDAFFLNARKGIAQQAYRPRHTRPGTPPQTPQDERPSRARESSGEEEALRATPSVPAGAESMNDAAQSWQTLLAKYSAAPALREPPGIPREGLGAMLDAAGRFVARVRLGSSRRWRPSTRGGRIDMRRTLRSSLQTGGEPGRLRYLDHPPRNPSFVVLIDGSRSMAEYGPEALQFAYALRRRSRRTSVFAFSTALREITRELSLPLEATGPFPGDLGEAWGGGTRIGQNVATFARTFAGRVDDDTVIFIISDGLDVGDIEHLRSALRTLSRRSAGVIWLNPLLALEGYEPISAGMRAARAYVTLHPLAGASSFDALRIN